MRLRWLRRTTCLCLVAILSLVSLTAHAEDSNVSVGVGDTILIVQGKTVSNAFVTISRGGSVIGTTTADAAGLYSQTYPAQSPGLRQVSVFAQTTNGNTTDVVSVNVNIAEHATTVVDLFLPPTISIANPSLAHGQPMLITGESCPACTITFYIDSSSYATTTADTDGQWQVSVSTTDLAAGQHTIFARAIDSGGAQSYPTTSRIFTVTASPSDPPAQLPVTEPQQPTPPILPPLTPVPKPSVPVITFPPPGIVWTSPTITLRGTAEPNTQVEVFDGGQGLGSTWANASGQWELIIGLESQDYQLRARSCRSGSCSDFSESLLFTARPSGAGLVIELQRTLFSIVQGQAINLTGQIKNGRGPYTITANWGQGQPDSFNQLATDINTRYTYNTPGQYTGWLEARDTNGRVGRVYFTVSVVPQPLISPLALAIIFLILLGLLAISILWRRQRLRRSKEPDQ